MDKHDAIKVMNGLDEVQLCSAIAKLANNTPDSIYYSEKFISDVKAQLNPIEGDEEGFKAGVISFFHPFYWKMVKKNLITWLQQQQNLCV